MSNTEYTDILTVELKVDCYAGENCDQHQKYWNCYAADDMQDEALSPDDHKFSIDLKDHPPGTKIIVSEPICPKCGLTFFDCNPDPDCDFSWSGFAEDLYS